MHTQSLRWSFAFSILFSFATTHTKTNEPAAKPKTEQVAHDHTKKSATSITDKLSGMLSASESTWFRLFLALMLGLFLSLTPCIYPMIPITIGILQSSGSTSALRNFFLASAYTVGIATTFALLGLLSAFTGALFGSFMASPWVIAAIIALLLYLAGAMIGLYEMYVPSFMRGGQSMQKGGSLLAAFGFGAISGTVASPCLSPGLVLLLSIVSKLGSPLLGFLLLFFFGIGLSVPLLVVGTFSGSLNMLPRAGMWMIEVKKLFGFMILGMCLYFLQPLVALHKLLLIAVVLCLCIGAYYMWHTTRTTGTWRFVNGFLGISLLLFAGWLSWQAYAVAYAHEDTTSLWLHDYDMAEQKAIQENKKLLVSFSAPYCSICKSIEKKHFTNQNVRTALAPYVLIKIDSSDTSHTRHQEIHTKYTILGVPTLLVIDPTTGTELKRWGSELYDFSTEQFAQELQE